MTVWRILSTKCREFILFAAAGLFGWSSAAAVELRGAGATFPAPLYQAWIERFEKRHPDISIRYEPVGSGEGMARFASGVVDFAGSDVPVPASGAERFKSIGAQLPATAGMIVLAYNLPGMSGRLLLPRSVYTDIYLGKIRRWNDPRIAAANPDLHLPAIDIAAIGRLDSSGTTFAFTSHLAAANPSWTANGPGVGKIVAWPNVAMLARGNEGVASRIKISEGGIGYVEYGVAQRLGLPMASLENKDGAFVAPTPETGAAALRASAHVGLDGLAASVVDPSGTDAYPIVTYSWLLFLRSYPPDQSRALRSLIDYALGDGQKISPERGYIPLPPAVAALGRAVVAHVLARDVGAAAPAAPEETAAPEAAPQSSTAAPPSAREETYTVGPGDTFKRIAIKFYHDARRWRDIAAANPGLDPRRRLRPGEILKLPESVGTADRPF